MRSRAVIPAVGIISFTISWLNDIPRYIEQPWTAVNGYAIALIVSILWIGYEGYISMDEWDVQNYQSEKEQEIHEYNKRRHSR